MEITGLFGFLIFVADVWAILKIVKSGATDGKKALWIAIVVVLPVVGLILWYLMGPGKPD
jgi:succinate dehydrogenase/fumarate reductase cytochrome b subunit